VGRLTKVIHKAARRHIQAVREVKSKTESETGGVEDSGGNEKGLKNRDDLFGATMSPLPTESGRP